MRDYRDDSIAAVEPTVPEVSSELPLNVTSIPKQLLTNREVEITETSPEDLLTALASNTLSSVEVTSAFLRRAGLAQRLVNCITELLAPEALTRAKYLDNYLKEHGKTIGPLHGLPISVKEHVAFKSKDINCGFVSRVGTIGHIQSHILELLWNAGCVFYARTTQPQTLMHLETSSNLYGETVCPYNRALTSGGSSGGEGALLGMRGSCMGIGTDIGGSIRSPAANNGVYGLRPTSYRLPCGGCQATMYGAEAVVPVIGPLSTSLEGIKVFMKTLVDQQPWLTEPSLLPFPWRYEQDWLQLDNKKLRVAVMWDDGVVKPHPPVTRALKELVNKLSGLEGIDLVDWTPYKHDWAWEIVASLYFADGGVEEIEEIEKTGEPWRPLSRFILTENPHVKAHTVPELWNWTMAREQYRAEYAELWNKSGVDVILCPVGPGAAPPLDCARYWGYTSQWNILDYPALVFPVSRVDQERDGKEEGFEPRNEKDRYNYDLCEFGMNGDVFVANATADEPEKYRDAPICLQLVGRRYDDEKILQALEYFQKHIQLPFSKLY